MMTVNESRLVLARFQEKLVSKVSKGVLLGEAAAVLGYSKVSGLAKNVPSTLDEAVARVDMEFKKIMNFLSNDI